MSGKGMVFLGLILDNERSPAAGNFPGLCCKTGGRQAEEIRYLLSARFNVKTELASSRRHYKPEIIPPVCFGT